ncbi:hypothetical protein ABPG74_006364 [Tetrahymena malaccensis]
MMQKQFVFYILLATLAQVSFAFSNSSTYEPAYKDWVLGMYEPQDFSAFKNVPQNLTYYEPGKLYMLHQDALHAFERMHFEAKKDNVTLILISALRNFPYQKRIWETKFQQLKNDDPLKTDELIDLEIMTYSAMPTTSRHHWGTDMDINSVEPEYFESGQGLIEYNWLKQNAKRFGFCQPYSPKNDGSRDRGYNLEQWHWSYMPISYQLLSYYRDNINYDDIQGFSGSQDAQKIHSIEDYVLSINIQCLNWKKSIESQ